MNPNTPSGAHTAAPGLYSSTYVAAAVALKFVRSVFVTSSYCNAKFVVNSLQDPSIVFRTVRPRRTLISPVSGDSLILRIMSVF